MLQNLYFLYSLTDKQYVMCGEICKYSVNIYQILFFNRYTSPFKNIPPMSLYKYNVEKCLTFRAEISSLYDCTKVAIIYRAFVQMRNAEKADILKIK